MRSLKRGLRLPSTSLDDMEDLKAARTSTRSGWWYMLAFPDSSQPVGYCCRITECRPEINT
jgi:hypothetical protein